MKKLSLIKQHVLMNSIPPKFDTIPYFRRVLYQLTKVTISQNLSNIQRIVRDSRHLLLGRS